MEPVITITTVLHSPLYLFWKLRYRTCQVFVYPFYPGNANNSEHILCIVGKIFSIGVEILGIGPVVMEIIPNQVGQDY